MLIWNFNFQALNGRVKVQSKAEIILDLAKSNPDLSIEEIQKYVEIKHQTVESVSALAREMKLEPIFTRDNELALDLDEGREVNPRVLKSLLASVLAPKIRPLITSSKSGNRHMYLRLRKPMDVRSRVSLQASLGSDPVKEMLSIRKLEIGSDPECAVAMFEKPEEMEQVMAWRALGE